MPALSASPVRLFGPPAGQPSAGDVMPDALRHAVRIRFACARDAELAARKLACEGARTWLECVPSPAAGRLALRRRDAELGRAIGAGQPPLRSVVLRYEDGQADLIVVCRRAFLSEVSLRRLAGLVTCPGTDPDVAELLAGCAAAYRGRPQTGRWAPRPAGPAWGLGDPTAGERVLTWRRRLDPAPGRGDLATWLAALATVIGRRDDGPAVLATLLPASTGAGGAPVPAELPAVVVVPADRDLTLGGLARRLRGEVADPGGSDGSLIARVLEPAPPELASPAVSLLQSAGGAGPSLEYLPCPQPITPLTISVTQDGTSMTCTYAAASFAPSVVRQLAGQLALAHRQVLESPERHQAARLEYGGARVIAEGRSRPPSRTRAARMDELVAGRARLHPDRVALSDGALRLSYAHVDARSDQIAHGLRAMGVRDGDRVGTCLPRSADLVLTLLGVLKAGAVYVPMDPAYPADRLSYTVRDAAVRVVIGTPGEFAGSGQALVITPAEAARLGAGHPPGPPPSGTSAASPAYVIYTSGSTGRPKGVVVPHASVVALADATRDDYQLGQSDVWTLFHSSAFDFSVWEMWVALLTGGRLVVVPHWVSRSPEEFAALVAQERATVLSQTPSAFGQLLTVDQRQPVDSSVRLVVFGGEPLDARMLLPWFDRHPEDGCRVVNMFGITETTVHVTAQAMTRRHALEGSRSVGRALPGWKVAVMDAAQRVVPPGVAGEIWVGGAGVSYGYLGRPGLTSQRFVPDPATGQRMYRSGDKGRLLPDGTLEHLGRLDSQVKVRGFRIELDEIRNVLLELPAVTAAAVVVNSADPASAADARIDAYVVLADPEVPTSQVRAKAATILPDYMLPASVTALPALPLTTNGKLDVASLPAPESGVPPAQAPAVPGDFVNDLLASWASVLRVQVGLDDDFFEHGGNSLCAVKVAATMRDLGWPRIPIRQIYQNPTVRRLAGSLGHALPRGG